MSKRKTQFRISHDVLSNVDESVKKELNRMTLSGGSNMRRALEKFEIHGKIEIAIARHKGKSFGWAMKRPYGENKMVMVFVKPAFRRLGIGTALVKSFRGKGIVYDPWNEGSRAFFKTIRK